MSDEESKPQEQLTQSELIELRAMIEKEKRWKWLATGARNIAVYVAVILGAITVSWDWIVKIIKNAAGGS